MSEKEKNCIHLEKVIKFTLKKSNSSLIRICIDYD